ncbi:MAG: 1-aminocyclopropane-1-carboxylate deaminase/D-cysteine desulfhydrase [Flavobacteriaceae bacterium]
MDFNSQIQSINQQIVLPKFEANNCQLFIKREDEIHPLVSGNKFRKLKYNLKAAKQNKNKTLLTFGGAFSNHILATAVAGKFQNFKTIGVIRGDELGQDLSKTLATNSTLRAAYEHGMKFEFISREKYRDKMSSDFLKKLELKYGDFYTLPEGGTNALAVKGCEEILTSDDNEFDYICSCVGTGGTIAGIINSIEAPQKVIGFPALKGDFLIKGIQQYCKGQKNWQLVSDYHFGGYGKYSDELIHFINRFKENTTIPLDPIYTGKMMFGVLDMIKKNSFPKGSKILIIHSGGIQGIEGFNYRLKRKNSDLKIL